MRATRGEIRTEIKIATDTFGVDNDVNTDLALARLTVYLMWLFR